LSKVVELGDTIFLVLQKKELSLLHVWHHASVLVMSWHQCLQLSGPVPIWVAMNMAVHAAMYAYFIIVEWEILPAAVTWRLAVTITTCQILQMLIGLGTITLAVHLKAGGMACRLTGVDSLICSATYFSYLLLFLHFADRAYGLRARCRSLIGSQHHNERGHSQESQETPGRGPEMQLLSFDAACARAPLLIGFMSTEEALQLYGLYKQVTCGDAPLEEASALESSSDMQCKSLRKLRAWYSHRCESEEECQEAYTRLVATIAARACSSVITGSQPLAATREIPAREGDSPLWRTRILGLGHYLPSKLVTNAEVESRGGFKQGSLEQSRVGVRERHQADPRESASSMAAAACLEALEAAGIQASDVDCILNASGTAQQAIPDGGPLLQSALGLQDSGIPAFSIHATCLSFLAALETGSAMLDRPDGRYKTILIAASEITSAGVDPNDAHTAALFGDGAAAAVIQRSAHGEASCIHKARMSTFSSGRNLIEIRAGGTQVPPFPRDPAKCHQEPSAEHDYDACEATLRFLAPKMAKELDALQPGLSQGLDGIDWVIPHQASGLALDSLAMFNWPRHRVLRTLEHCGNCVAASIPMTLHYGVSSGKVRRGQRLLLCGTSAGVSFGGMILTY